MRYFSFIFLLLLHITAQGQVLKGIVTDAETAKPLHTVTVTNLVTHQVTYTNVNGAFAISANDGEQVSFSYVGYASVKRVTPPALGSADIQVQLAPSSIQLQEFVFRKLTPYQQDSLDMQNLYKKELNVQRIKPSFGTTGNGIGVSGLLGSAVQKISRSYKEDKRFKEEFKKSEEQKFIDTRYTPELVAVLTGIPAGDTLAFFMNSYPMEYDFARAASDLELKMWIRTNYKEYLKKNKK